MSGTLDWTSDTNLKEGSCKGVSCGCDKFLAIYQQTTIKLLSHRLSHGTRYKLEPGYEARARRIAANYARVFLEDSTFKGKTNLMGRFYWMGLGAFASKTMAMIFSQKRSKFGYQFNFADAQEPLNILAKGNLWLFMDILPWHLAWMEDRTGYDYCAKYRETEGIKLIRPAMLNLPWSSVLPKLKFFKHTDEIINAFGQLNEIERIFQANISQQEKFTKAQRLLFTHMKLIAIQEQKNILQEICWKDPVLIENVKSQRGMILSHLTIDTTLVLSSEYELSTIQDNRNNKSKSESKLSTDPWSSPPSNMKVEVYGDDKNPDIYPDSRMYWILKGAAPKYHQLMLNELGRQYLITELGKISTWRFSTANPDKINPNSNEGKK